MSEVQALASPAGTSVSMRDVEPRSPQVSEDRRALLEATYAEDYRVIATYLYRRTGDHELAGELASETFAHALASLSRWVDEGAPLRCWLLRIATRRLAHHRRWGVRRDRLLRLVGMRTDARSPSVTCDDGVARLRAAIAALPSHAQDVLYLYHVEELSVRETSIVLDIPEGTVKSRLARAREQIASSMNDSSASVHKEHRHANTTR